MNIAPRNCPLVKFATTVQVHTPNVGTGLLQKRLEFESLSMTLSFT